MSAVKRNHRKMSNSDAIDSASPAKRLSVASTLKYDLNEMVDRLQKRTYQPLLSEMQLNPKWQSNSFQSKIIKAFSNCSREGQKVADEYKSLQRCLDEIEEKYTKLQEKLQDFEQRVYEAEEECQTSKLELASKNEELNGAYLLNERMQIKTNLLEKEITELKNDASDAENGAADVIVKSLQQLEEKSDERIDNLKELFEAGNQKVNAGIENLAKNLSTILPSEKKEEGPEWMVKKEICESILKNVQNQVEPFINKFLTELFKLGELILPGKDLNKKKLAETNAVIVYFFKVIDANQKEFFFKIVETSLTKLRNESRKNIYKMMKNFDAIGLTPEGRFLFYNREANGKLHPFSDELFYHPMEINGYIDKSYGIPAEHISSDFLIIVEKSINNDIVFYQADPNPKSGYKTQIYSKRQSKKNI